MSEENRLRSLVVKTLRSLLAFPVENGADVGTPDVCCLAGWIELKIGEISPTGKTKVVVRPAQRLWMRRWCDHGGPGWWLTKWYASGHTVWSLHGGEWGADHLGRVSARTHDDNAIWIADTPESIDSVTNQSLTRALVESRSPEHCYRARVNRLAKMNLLRGA